MDSLGEFLKIERESRNISLEEISNKTRISVKILKAIESDDKEALPGDVFVKGFLRSYAQYLDIDEKEVLSGFGASQMSPDAVDPDYHREVIDDFFEKKSNKHLYYAALIVIILVLIYLYYGSDTTSKSTTSKSAKKSEDIKTEKLEQNVFVIEDKSAQKKITLEESKAAEAARKNPPKAPTAKPVVTAPAKTPAAKTAEKRAYTVIPAGEGHKLTFRSDGIVWMLIQIDDDEAYEVTMHEGEVYKIRAREKFTLKIGDAGKVRVELDGTDLGYLGNEKQVKRVTLPKPE